MSSCLRGGDSLLEFTSEAVGLEWDHNQTVDLGDVSVGSALSQTFVLYNKSTYPAVNCNSLVLSDPLNFSVLRTTCSSSIPANGSCEVEVQASPQSAGAKNLNLSVQCSIQQRPSSSIVNAVVQGLTTNMSWSPDTMDYGSVGAGLNSSAEEFILTNNGAIQAVSCGLPYLSNTTDFIIDSDTCGTSNLSAGSSCSVFVKARPQSVGTKTTTLSRNCANTGVVSTQLNQIQVQPIGALLSLSPSSYNFGSIQVGAPNEVFKFTFENSGYLPATGCGMATLSNVTDFSIVNEDCGMSDLAAGTSCSVWVKASPSNTGAKATTLSRSCASDGVLKTNTDGITVTGTAATYLADWVQEFAITNLGVVSLGKSSAEFTYFYRNTTVHPLTGCTVPTLTNTTDFTLTNYTCSAGSMAAASTCFVTVRAHPQTAGSKSTTISRSCNQAGTSAVSSLSATGVDDGAALVIGLREVKNVAGKSDHRCSLQYDRTVKCWGSGTHGELGDGTTNSSSIALTVDGLKDVQSIHPFSQGTCALMGGSGVDRGKIKCWGSNDDYWGDGSTTDSMSPIAITGIESVQQFEASAERRCILIGAPSPDAGKVQCWGRSQLGSLGDGTGNDRLTPVEVSGLSGVTQITVGLLHSCALLSDQTVRCWGRNNFGQLGDGTTNVAMTPVAVSGLALVEEISAGDYHTCARLSDGSVQCWGKNTSGQLGDGTNTQRNNFVNVDGLVTTAQKISSGSDHTCAILDDGSAQCWGSNYYGQLGDGTSIDRWAPVTVLQLSRKVISISAAEKNSCVSLVDRTVKCWGNNDDGQLGDNTNISSTLPVAVKNYLQEQITSGASHACHLSKNGRVRCWGSSYGRAPTLIENGVVDAIQISSRGNHTCALLLSGEVKCWGSNQFGQLGNGLTSGSLPVTVTNGLVATQVVVGNDFSCALLESGEIKCWGRNANGQFGDGSTTNSAVPVPAGGGMSGVVQLEAGSAYTCVLLENSEVKCWGSNSVGQLGLGNTTSISSPSGTAISGLQGTVKIIAGASNTCALFENGAVKCWGMADSGALGDGTTYVGSLKTPAVSAIAGLSDTVDIKIGSAHVCALNSMGEVRCWGNNNHGQLGDGTKKQRNSPVLSVTGAKALGISTFHSCALNTSAQVKCWGDNSYGQLGDGSKSTFGLPFPVADGFSNIKQIVVLRSMGCILLDDGEVKCWGITLGELTSMGLSHITKIFAPSSSTPQNVCALSDVGEVKCWGYGYLGVGAASTSYTPITVTGLSDIVDVAVGTSHTCVVIGGNGVDKGKVRCWGLNSNGQLGDGTTTTSNTPLPTITGLSDVVGITVGNAYTCALIGGDNVDKGRVRCWGKNTSGQLGDGTTTDSSSPLPAITGLSDVVSVVAGESHTCAVIGGTGVESGKVRCWGANASGQLGDGTTINRSSPISTIAGLSDVTSVALGSSHTCALMGGVGPDNSRIKCWGKGDQGVIGDGSLTSRLSPVYRLNQNPSQFIFSGADIACSVDQAGEATCSGYGEFNMFEVVPAIRTVSGI